MRGDGAVENYQKDRETGLDGGGERLPDAAGRGSHGGDGSHRRHCNGRRKNPVQTPDFRDFWVEKPSNAKQKEIFRLVTSSRLIGDK